MFSLEKADKSWLSLFSSSQEVLESIFSAVSEAPYLPENERVLRFSRMPLSSVRVVILGQDPYPQPGAATGRSFEVGTVSSWTQPFRQSSLRNILRAIYAAYEGEPLAWSAVREKIARGEFRILPPDRLWDDLEAQGVLFLNAYLTVAPGKRHGAGEEAHRAGRRLHVAGRGELAAAARCGSRFRTGSCALSTKTRPPAHGSSGARTRAPFRPKSKTERAMKAAIRC